jgi:nucleotide-binding universal stress UspA family protein
MKLDIVLCPIDLSACAERELAIAADLCERFGARLVVHHNLSAAPPGLSKSWEWDQSHRKDEPSHAVAQKRVEGLLRQLPESLRAEALITAGPLATILLGVAETLPADLIVIATHGSSTADHSSVAERVLERASCPILAIHDTDALQAFRLSPGPARRVVVPTDFSASASKAVAFAIALARKFALELNLVHVSAGPGADAALEALARLVPTDLKDNARCHLRIGHTVEEIDAVVRLVRPELIVMGTHVREFWHRLLTRDVARRILRGVNCPVCFVPATAVIETEPLLTRGV